MRAADLARAIKFETELRHVGHAAARTADVEQIAIAEAIADLRGYQWDEEIPRLFWYAQLLLAANAESTRYGTARTPAEFYAVWHELVPDAELREVLSRAIPVEERMKLFWRREEASKLGEEQPTRQDHAVYCLLRPQRLLELVRGFIVYGVLAAICGLLPFGGAALVWLPAAAWLLLSGKLGWGIFMLAWGGIVSTSDNFIRPVIISRYTPVPTLLVFIGVIGGVAAFGALGFILGPLILVLATELFRFAEGSMARRG